MMGQILQLLFRENTRCLGAVSSTLGAYDSVILHFILLTRHRGTTMSIWLPRISQAVPMGQRTWKCHIYVLWEKCFYQSALD